MLTCVGFVTDRQEQVVHESQFDIREWHFYTNTSEMYCDDQE